MKFFDDLDRWLYYPKFWGRIEGWILIVLFAVLLFTLVRELRHPSRHEKAPLTKTQFDG